MQPKTMPVLPYPVFMIGRLATEAAEITRETALKVQTMTEKTQPAVKNTEMVEEKTRSAEIRDETIREKNITERVQAEPTLQGSLRDDTFLSEDKALKEAALEETTRISEAVTISNIEDESLEDVLPTPPVVETTDVDTPEPVSADLDMYT